MAGNGLVEVFSGQDRVGDRQVVVERHAAHACTGFVGHQLEVVSLAADDAAQRNQRVVLGPFGHGLQGHGHFQCTRHHDVVDAGDTQGFELFNAGFGQGIGDVFVEARLHDADVQKLAVEFFGLAFIGVLHVYSLGM